MGSRRCSATQFTAARKRRGERRGNSNVRRSGTCLRAHRVVPRAAKLRRFRGRARAGDNRSQDAERISIFGLWFREPKWLKFAPAFEKAGREIVWAIRDPFFDDVGRKERAVFDFGSCYLKRTAVLASIEPDEFLAGFIGGGQF